MILVFISALAESVLFKNSGMDQVIPQLDLNYVILETDCPYLAPVPHRGKRNEPMFTHLISEKVAQLRSLPLGEVIKITNNNSKVLFRIDK